MYIRKKRRESDPRPAWMRTLHTTATNWLSMIPKVREIAREYTVLVVFFLFFFQTNRRVLFIVGFDSFEEDAGQHQGSTVPLL